MRLILTGIFLMLAVLAAGALGRYIATVTAIGVAIALFLAVFGIGIYMVILGLADESFGLQLLGCLVIVTPVIGARRLWSRRS